jgi:Family of unknown function (DUF6502)
VSKRKPKKEVLRAAKNLFEALAPRFVKHGITSSEVESLLRTVLVHEAARVSRQYGRRPNASQVAIKTGVDRHIVSRLLKGPLTPSRLRVGRRDPTRRVLDGWASDRAYSLGSRLREIPIGDPQSKGRTAWALVKRYAPGVWPRLVIDELIRLNYVDVSPNGLLRCKNVVSHGLDQKLIQAKSTADSVRDFTGSLVEFLLLGQQGTWRATQRVAIKSSKAPLVRKLIRTRLDSVFAELTEELGSTRWQSRISESASDVVLGITAFTFEQTAEQFSGSVSQRKSRRRT